MFRNQLKISSLWRCDQFVPGTDGAATAAGNGYGDGHGHDAISSLKPFDEHSRNGLGLGLALALALGAAAYRLPHH
ncbi:GL19945 [Drosophila persimilis]|uniref:GL19945 n=1 Tax=Drosophila persimilis TaxID=7234 RepID=B4GYL1_DROPE|nr:GL19945 [Drosophila persimilis]